jgi:hypothetical protein
MTLGVDVVGCMLFNETSPPTSPQDLVLYFLP